MKLLYQWLIVLALSVLLIIVHVYGGPVCSRPTITRPAAVKIMRPPRLILVKPREKPNPDRTLVSVSPLASPKSVPAVPNTPSSKQRKRRRQKLNRKQKASLARRLSQVIDDPEWVFVKQGS